MGIPSANGKGAWLCSLPGLSLTHSALGEATLTMVQDPVGEKCLAVLRSKDF